MDDPINLSLSEELAGVSLQDEKKTFYKDVPMSPDQSWDFSLQSLNPEYKSKCIWLEGSFYQKLHGECFHEMNYVQCPCDEHKKSPLCRLCHIPFCSTACFKQITRAQQGLKNKQADGAEVDRLSSTSETESRSRSPNVDNNLKGASSCKQNSKKGGEGSRNGSKSSFKENRKGTDAQGGTKKLQNQNDPRHKSREDIGSNPQFTHQRQFPSGYNDSVPGTATSNKSTYYGQAPPPYMSSPHPQGGQPIDKFRGLLPDPPAAVSMHLPTGVVSPYQPKNSPYYQDQNQIRAQVMMSPSQLKYPLLHPEVGKKIMNALNRNNHNQQIPSSSSMQNSSPDIPVKILRNPKAAGVQYHEQSSSSHVENANDSLHSASNVTNWRESNTSKPFAVSNNNPTGDFNQPGNNKKRHNVNGKNQQINNQKSSWRNDNASTLPTKSPHADDSPSGVHAQRLQSGTGRSRSVGYERQQEINDLKNFQTNFRLQENNTVAIREDDRSGSLGDFRQHGRKEVHFQDSPTSFASGTRRDTSKKTFDSGGETFSKKNSGNSRSSVTDDTSFKSAGNTMSTSRAKFSTSQSNMATDNEIGFTELELIKADPDIPYGVPIQVKHMRGESFYDFTVFLMGNDADVKIIGSTLQTCAKDRMFYFEYNDFCMVNAPSEIAGEWHRAIITKIVGKVGVYLLDLGVSTVVEPDSIYKLPTELINYKPLAIRVKCLNMKADMSDPDVCDYFSSLVEDKIVKVKITHKVPWESSMYAGSLEVLHISKWFDVGVLLQKFQVAESVCESDFDIQGLVELQEAGSRGDNTLHSVIGDTVQAMVSHAVTVNEFYVSTKESIKRRFKIELKLNNPSILSKCQHVKTLKDLAHPMFILRDDQSEMQVRVKVLEVAGPESAIVQKIDYGDTLTVSVSDLKLLPTDLHEPSCVFKCSLPIKPAPKSRTSKPVQPMSYDDLTNYLVELYDRNVVLFVFSIENLDTHVVELALEDSSGCANSFVNKGWATLSHDVDLQCLKKKN